MTTPTVREAAAGALLLLCLAAIALAALVDPHPILTLEAGKASSTQLLHHPLAITSSTKTSAATTSTTKNVEEEDEGSCPAFSSSVTSSSETVVGGGKIKELGHRRRLPAKKIAAAKNMKNIHEPARCSALADCGGLEEAPPHVTVAEGLVQGLQISKATKYFDGAKGLQHVKWAGSCSEAFVDSSSLMTVLLYHSDGWNAKDFDLAFGTANPIAADYYRAGLQEKNFVRISKLAESRKGDFIFIRYPNNEHKVSGHCMMIDGAPQAAANAEAVPAGQKAFDIVVIDAAKKPHGPEDTRAKNPGKWGSTGVGRGTIRVLVKDDVVTAYAWSNEPAAPFHPITDRPLVIARMDDTLLDNAN